jgi:hypothetical protein
MNNAREVITYVEKQKGKKKKILCDLKIKMYLPIFSTSAVVAPFRKQM